MYRRLSICSFLLLLCIRAGAQRLYGRCPEIFRQKDSKLVSSRSTNVHRVIQSMGHFNASLKACQSDLVITMLTGDRYWDILCHDTSNLDLSFESFCTIYPS